MAWTFNSNRIYVTELSGSDKQIIARLQPFGGGTIQQTFGYEDEILKVRAYVVGDTILDALKALTATGTEYDFTGDQGSMGNYYLSNLSWSRVPAIWQTIAGDCTDPLYTVELELT